MHLHSYVWFAGSAYSPPSDVAAPRNVTMAPPGASRGYDSGASPSGNDTDRDDGMFWDYGGDADNVGKGSSGVGAGGQSSAIKVAKGACKTLNKTEANIFAKWCRKIIGIAVLLAIHACYVGNMGMVCS